MGEHSGRRYSMGDRVRVVLDHVDPVQRRLQFSILEEVAPVASPGQGQNAGSVGQSAPLHSSKNKVLRKGKQSQNTSARARNAARRESLTMNN